MTRDEVIFVGDVPLPLDTHVKPGNPMTFSGIWTGRWDSIRNHMLIIEGVDEDGLLDIIYAVGKGADTPGTWYRLKAKVEDECLVFAENGFTARYWVTPSGRIKGVYGVNAAFAVLERQIAADVLADPGKDWFSVGDVERIKTEFTEDGRSVSLNTVVYRPSGPGPFPLALMHHGSTGLGLNPDDFDQVWFNDWLADCLASRGWLVAFLQRRGRGGSDGLYDEGFAEDRSQGYSLKAELCLEGAEHALMDANAALAAFSDRSEVAPGHILLGGESRGGVLAIMQAGDHPKKVVGVVNFVGGWTGENWGDPRINPTLFKRIGAFQGPVLSFYGENDPFYSVEHSKANLAELDALGVENQLHVINVPGKGNGHAVIEAPHLWQDAFEGFLADIEPQRE